VGQGENNYLHRLNFGLWENCRKIFHRKSLLKNAKVAAKYLHFGKIYKRNLNSQHSFSFAGTWKFSVSVRKLQLCALPYFFQPTTLPDTTIGNHVQTMSSKQRMNSYSRHCNSLRERKFESRIPPKL